MSEVLQAILGRRVGLERVCELCGEFDMLCQMDDPQCQLHTLLGFGPHKRDSVGPIYSFK
jgi:hypothetical protein